MAEKDYSETQLSQKLGAEPGAGVVVFFTTSREDLARRFAGLKATLDPADGLWIAWPKKAAMIGGDLTFEAVQEIGLAHGLVDNKSCSIERRGFDSARGYKRGLGLPPAWGRHSRPRVRRREELVEGLEEDLLDGVAEPAPVVVGDPAVGAERHGLLQRDFPRLSPARRGVRAL